jgi:Spy/CpxP family protein refolding chaperone
MFILAAQPPGGGRGFGGPGGPGGGLAYLTGYLSLSDAQVAQAKTIFDAARTASQTPAGAAAAARESLRTAIKSNATANIDSLAAQIGTAEGQITAINAKAQAQFYALLTADQKTKYDSRTAGGGPRGARAPQ